MDNLDAYLTSIERVQGSIKDLNDANLGFCHVTIRRLVQIHKKNDALFMPCRNQPIALQLKH
jgi:hypothetical protein